MTQDPTLTEMLRTVTDAGASGAFVAVLATDAPKGTRRHHPRSKVRHRMSGPGGVPGPFGGFLTALWEGDTTAAWRRADSDNRRLMESAGLAPRGRQS